MWWQWIVGISASFGLLWVLLLATLWLAKPDEQRLRESLRLLPDVIRLVTRLARDKSVPISARVRLWGLLGYLAMPIDIVPDFIPVLGYADDAIIVVLVLRSVIRRTGRATVAEHWPGTEEGLNTLVRLGRL